MVIQRRGRLGCLFSLLVAAVMIYYGIPLVRVYWDYYKLADEMKVTARFASSMSDEDVLRRLRAVVDQLDLPAEAKRFTIRRVGSPPLVMIRTQYRQVIELPFHRRTLTFRPATEFRH